MEKVRGLLKLTRYREVIPTHLTFTLMGAFVASTEHRWDLMIGVITANILTGLFAFMINDLEDWEDDYQDEKKRKRNPIAAGIITYKFGLLSSFVVMFAALFIYALLGLATFIFGSLAIFVGLLYSWKKVRLKGKPIWDVISHMYFVDTFAVVTGFLAFANLSQELILPFLIVMFISIAGEMNNEIRDFESDKKVGLKNTANTIGLRNSKLLQKASIICFMVASIAFLLSYFVRFNLVLLAVFIIFGILTTMYSFYKSREVKIVNNGHGYLHVNSLASALLLVSIYF